MVSRADVVGGCAARGWHHALHLDLVWGQWLGFHQLGCLLGPFLGHGPR